MAGIYKGRWFLEKSLVWTSGKQSVSSNHPKWNSSLSSCSALCSPLLVRQLQQFSIIQPIALNLLFFDKYSSKNVSRAEGIFFQIIKLLH